MECCSAKYSERPCKGKKNRNGMANVCDRCNRVVCAMHSVTSKIPIDRMTGFDQCNPIIRACIECLGTKKGYTHNDVYMPMEAIFGFPPVEHAQKLVTSL